MDEMMPDVWVGHGSQADLWTADVTRDETMRVPHSVSTDLCSRGKGDRPGEGPSTSMKHWQDPSCVMSSGVHGVSLTSAATYQR